MTADVAQFVREYVITSDLGPILVVAWNLPTAFSEYAGPLTFIGCEAFPGRIASTDYTAHIRRGGDHEMSIALRRQSERQDQSYGLVCLDANHGIESLIDQINVALRTCSPEAVFLLPGAAPPARGMATSLPSQDWWVGDVWTLVEILRSNGATVHTSGLEPTGMLLASGVAPIDPEEARRTAARLQASICDDETFQRQFQHANLTELLMMLDMAAGEVANRERVRVLLDEAQPDVIRSTLIDPVLTWDRPPPFFLCDLSGKELATDHVWRRERVVHGVKVDEFENALLYGRDLILAGSLTGDYLNCYTKNWESGPASGWLHMIAKDPENSADVSTSLTEEKGHFVVRRSLLEGATKLDGPIFTGTPDEYLNYGMWLLYTVPGISLFNDMKSHYPHYMAYMDRPWQRQLLLDLGLEPDELLAQKLDTVYAAPSLATMRHSSRSLSLSATDLAAFDALGERAVRSGGAKPERIFISRRSRTKAGAYRGLLNEDELVNRMQLLGFTVVEPELYPIMDQARIFRDARVVVGLGGAGMFNVAFCRPGTIVIDIESGADWIDAHAELFASTGVSYGFILGDTDETDPSPSQKRWRLDIDRAVSAILNHI